LKISLRQKRDRVKRIYEMQKKLIIDHKDTFQINEEGQNQAEHKNNIRLNAAIQKIYGNIKEKIKEEHEKVQKSKEGAEEAAKTLTQEN